MKLGRPRCDICGDKIFVRRMSIRSRLTDRIFGGIPSHCPNCGSPLSNEKRAQLDTYETQLFCLMCSIFILFIFIIVLVVSVS